jgi:hypothetical protein
MSLTGHADRRTYVRAVQPEQSQARPDGTIPFSTASNYRQVQTQKPVRLRQPGVSPGVSFRKAGETVHSNR